MEKKKVFQYSKDYYSIVEEFRVAYSKCINEGIHISPTCISNNSKWKIIIEFKNKDGDVVEFIESDSPSINKAYYSKEEYMIKMMKLYIHYAKDL